MSFDWTGFLGLADELALRAEEAAKRTAISRAYYFAFNLAYARAERTAGPKPRDKSFHEWCWNKYIQSTDMRCRQIGLSGSRLKSLRVKADYKPNDGPRIADAVARAIADARSISGDLVGLPAHLPQP
jgi:hypothetical protein